MQVSLERPERGYSLIFGGSMVLERFEIDPLRYNGEYPGDQIFTKRPQARYVTIEGYIVPDGDTPEARSKGTSRRRDILCRICSPDGEFVLRIGDRYAMCADGALKILRKAPFSGDTSEHFILTARIVGGYFFGRTVRAEIERPAEGTTLPGYIPETGIAFGVLGDTSQLLIDNRGDVACGFTAEIVPDGLVRSFGMHISPTEKRLLVESNFNSEDVINICTARDSLNFTVIRNTVHLNLSGYATDDSTLFLLPPGESVITFIGGTYSGYLEYKELFISA